MMQMISSNWLPGPNRFTVRIALATAIIELLIIFSVSVVFYRTHFSSLEQRTYHALSALTAHVDTVVSKTLAPLDIHASLVANRLSEPDLPSSEIGNILDSFLNNHPSIISISLVSGNAVNLNSRSRSTSPHSVRNIDTTLIQRGVLQEISPTTKTLDRIVIGNTGQPVIQHIIPIMANQHLTNALIIAIDIVQMLSAIDLRFWNPDQALYMSDTTNLLYSFNRHGPGFDMIITPDQTLRSALFDRRDRSYSLQYVNHSKQPVFGWIENLGQTGLSVIAEQDVRSAAAPAREILVGSLIAAAVIIPGTGLLLSVMFRQLMRPLMDFEDAIEKVASGDRNVRIRKSSHLQFSSLAKSFNAMASRLDRRILELLESEKQIRESEENYRQLNETLQNRVNQATEELRKTNAKLQETARQAEQANRAKSAFLAKMSHELRTPLNAIIGYTEILLEDAMESKSTQQCTDLSNVLGAAKHLLGLINDILDLSKIEAGKMEVVYETISVPSLINEVCATVQPLLRRNNNRLIVECPASVGQMHTDVKKLRQCLLNILGNACKFTSNGEVSLLVSKEQSDTRSVIHFVIKDTGIGIDRRKQPELFHSFVQADPCISQKFGGTGLGLAITKHFTDMLGGTISIQSELGKGTTFDLAIPQQAPDGQAQSNGALPASAEISTVDELNDSA